MYLLPLPKMDCCIRHNKIQAIFPLQIEQNMPLHFSAVCHYHKFFHLPTKKLHLYTLLHSTMYKPYMEAMSKLSNLLLLSSTTMGDLLLPECSLCQKHLHSIHMRFYTEMLNTVHRHELSQIQDREFLRLILPDRNVVRHNIHFHMVFYRYDHSIRHYAMPALHSYVQPYFSS